MDTATLCKLQRLRERLAATGGCAVAFSGGVDSSLLLAVAHQELGSRCLAVIGASPTYPKQELEEALGWAASRGIACAVVATGELDDPSFQNNPPERCYYCKRVLFSKVKALAAERGLTAVAEGSNADDRRDFRPGRRAAQELAILSPLDEAGLTKPEIRRLASDIFNLPMAAKPATACLASRFQYGTIITPERLAQVENLEQWLHGQGFRVVRARYHGEVVRLELGSEEEALIHNTPELRQRLVRTAKQLGFRFVSLDLEGFRSGSANEGLDLL